MLDLIQLRYWNLYFVAALGLHFSGHLQFNVWLNLLLVAFLLLPTPRAWARVRDVLAAVLALGILYHESWWPPVGRVVSEAKNLTGFSLNYLSELLGRAIDLWAVAGVVILVGAGLLVKRYFDPSRWVIAAIFLPLLPLGIINADVGASMNTEADNAKLHQAALDDELARFFAGEAPRHAVFEPLAAGESPYDIIVLHICSLAWSDLDYAQQRQHALLKRFDIVFTDFNSVTPYSGVAMIRALRSSCGQHPHDDMFAPPPRECLTFGHLERIGFENQLLLNHDGKYADFLQGIRRLGGFSAPLFTHPDDRPYLKAFDDTPIARDYDVVSQWWQNRLQTHAPRVALYYNSVSLHDGNRYAAGEFTDQDSAQTFPTRVNNMLDDINRIVDLIEASGRNAILVMLPEHGSAVKGDKSQMAGLREIPSPMLTRVPVGVKLIGGRWGKAHTAQIRVTQPSSYLAVAQLLSNFTRRDPFAGKAGDLQSYVSRLPQTDFVADSASTFIVRHGRQYLLHRPGKSWEVYDPS